MRLFLVFLASVAALLAVGVSSAQTMIPYRPQPQPLILGEVQEETDHSVTVRTDAGEMMTFRVDSRSVVPTALPPGTPVSIEFHVMPNGDTYAARVTPVEKGSPEAEHIAMAMSATGNAERTEAMPASYTSTSGEEPMDHQQMAANEPMAANEETPREERTESAAVERAEDQGNLPRTASNRPLTLALGSLCLGLGTGAWLGRRRRAA